MSSRRGSSTQTAKSTPFTNTNTSIRGKSVDRVLNEFTEKTIKIPIITTNTLNGTLQLTNSSNTLQVIKGTQTGYSIKLPDATSLFKGEHFQIYNKTTQSILIKDFNNTVLATLNQNDYLETKLEDNSSSPGSWLSSISSDAATGILSYSIGSDTIFSTSSSTDVLITGLTATPVSGRYACYFSSDLIITNNNRIAQAVFYSGGVSIERSRRRVQGVGSNFRAAYNLVAEITVNGSQAIDVRVNIDSGSIDVGSRRMILIRLGV